jgi:hypothetical protein
MPAKAKNSTFKRKPKSKPVKKTAKADKAPELALRRDPKRVNENSKTLFLDHHLPLLAKLKTQAATAQANLRNGYRTAKKDGFLQRDFDVAFRLKTQLGEKALKTEIARDMTIAKWLGFSLGKQLDLFVQADDHDIEAQAYADGEEASRTNKPAAPIYAPETVGFEAYMRGFHDHQAEIGKGFKKVAATKQFVGEPAASGVPMTRSQFKALSQRAAAKKAEAAEVQADKPMFSKKNGPPVEAA